MSLTSSSDSLRDEIVSSQITRTEYLKLKLITVAAIASAALGLGQSSGPPDRYHYLLCLIPFACVFCDLLCAHLALKIHVIAVFLRCEGDSYEAFVRDVRAQNVFILESAATWYSSITLSLLILLFLVLTSDEWKFQRLWPFCISGLLGVVLTLLVWGFAIRYDKKLRREGEKRLLAAESGKKSPQPLSPSSTLSKMR